MTPASSSSSSKTESSRSSESTQTSREEIRSKTATPKSESEEYPSSQSVNMNIPLQEPDVIASTKLAHSKTTDNILSNRPIPPPRIKRKNTATKEQLLANTKPLSSSTDNIRSKFEDIKVTRSDSATQLKLVMPTTSSSIDAPEKPQEQQVSYSPGTIRDAITRELENSFAKAATSTPITTITKAQISGSMSRISHSLGNSASSVNVKPSPSNSAKSNSAPARVR